MAAEPPDLRIHSGDPTPVEEEAARAAVLELWRKDQAEAARAAGLSAWVATGRAEATRRSGFALRGRAGRAWRWAGRLGETSSNIQIGRGDAR